MSKIKEIPCWSCQEKILRSSLFCSHCHKVQKPRRRSHFRVLGLPRLFPLKLDRLENKYFSLQSQIHPDRFVGASDQEKLYAQEHSVRANLAYQTLKDPLKRAQHLLDLMGFPPLENGTQDPDLLLEILSFQESLERDKENTLQEMRERSLYTFKILEQAFQDKDYGLAEKVLTRLKYFKRFQENS